MWMADRQAMIAAPPRPHGSIDITLVQSLNARPLIFIDSALQGDEHTAACLEALEIIGLAAAKSIP